MGYTITIGQAEPSEPFYPDGDGETEQYGFTVASREFPDAPAAPGDVNPRCNYRWPSYSVWANFAREVGLHALFLGDDDSRSGGLLRPHPGVAVLRPHHAATIHAALDSYRSKHPEAVARFDVYPPGTSPIDEMTGLSQHPDCDYALARLEWVSWWVDWALANCSRPAMANS